ncbi:myotubularin-related protein 10-B [Anabrus simplex]|uniref:myotubularin-related protein 10-B n=1 Tax=Anabrus simplex TaxID=316456 RepID=UPI0035A2C49A
MNDRMSNSFKSYVGIEDYDLQSSNASGDESLTELNPRLLPGEMVIAEAQNVLLFAPVSKQNQGKSGTLSVTNFKLSFVTTEERPKENVCQQSCLLGEHDVCLSNVDVICQIVDKKKRKLSPGTSVSGKVKGLYIMCKNMKVMTFSFKFSPVGHGKTLTNALLHHAFPRRHQLVFAYDFREPYYSCLQDSCWFRLERDWQLELDRTGCSGWKTSAANYNFHISTSLPQWLVVPATVLDWQLVDAARHFRASRPPVWCWGTKHGAALVRMADLLPGVTERTQENIMLEQIRKSHPTLKPPNLLDLGKDLPSPRDVQISFNKLRDLCAPASLEQFQLQEKDFLAHVDSTRWLHYISLCLAKADEAAKAMHNDTTVVLQEGDGRDMCCVVASLVQMLVDPYWRTHVGFQTLVQKEWVVMGHPFATRLAHVYQEDSEQSPVFLVFLDCVWQLTQQFPTAFEFTETFLTTVWDSAHISIFDTFLFDCERDRLLADMTLRSVWDWGEQFQDQRDIELFTNPLYTVENSILRPQCSISMLSLWSQCYHRWVPLLEIPGGGQPQIDMYIRFLVAEIVALQSRLEGGDSSAGDKFLPKTDCHVGSFFPFGYGGGQPAALLSSSLAINSSFLAGDALLDSQSLLNAPD